MCKSLAENIIAWKHLVTLFGVNVNKTIRPTPLNPIDKKVTILTHLLYDCSLTFRKHLPVHAAGTTRKMTVMKTQQFSSNWTSSDPAVTVNVGHLNGRCRRRVQGLRFIRWDSTFRPLHSATHRLLIKRLGTQPTTQLNVTYCILRH